MQAPLTVRELRWVSSVMGTAGKSLVEKGHFRAATAPLTVSYEAAHAALTGPVPDACNRQARPIHCYQHQLHEPGIRLCL